MTDKEKERERIVLKRADAYKILLKTEGWQDYKKYLMIRINGLKNRLAKIDLGKNLAEAAKIQGKIDFGYSISNKIENDIKEAEIIRKRKKEEKKEK